MKKVGVIFIFCLLGVIGCHPKVPEKKICYKKVSEFEKRKIVRDLDLKKQGLCSWESLQSPLKKTLKYLQKRKFNKIYLSDITISKEKLIQSIEHLLDVLPLLDKDPYILVRDFDFYELSPRTFFTGYFEMDIEASFKKDEIYKYPIYSVPCDLKKADLGKFHPRWKGQTLIYRLKKDSIAPYYTREEIDRDGAILDKAKVIAWAKSPVDVFFLQIQGSGRLILPEGTFKYIGYAGKNGRQYVSLGKYMIDKGLIKPEKATLDGIINYLNSHPELLPDILFVNPSYVFFRVLKDGPVGAIGVKLTPMVSLATDPKIIPLGTIGIYQVALPNKENKKQFKGIFMAQDVGGAITNNHVDLFFGFGENARKMAGSMSQYGKIYLLIKK